VGKEKEDRVDRPDLECRSERLYLFKDVRNTGGEEVMENDEMRKS